MWEQKELKSLGTCIYGYIVFCLAGAGMRVLVSREATTCASEWLKLPEPGKPLSIHCPEQKTKNQTLHVWFSSHLDLEFSLCQEESRHWTASAKLRSENGIKPCKSCGISMYTARKVTKIAAVVSYCKVKYFAELHFMGRQTYSLTKLSPTSI